MLVIMAHETPRCPNCSKKENIVNVCGHCNYHYPVAEEWDRVDVVFMWILVFFIIGSFISGFSNTSLFLCSESYGCGFIERIINGFAFSFTTFIVILFVGFSISGLANLIEKTLKAFKK